MDVTLGPFLDTPCFPLFSLKDRGMSEPFCRAHQSSEKGGGARELLDSNLTFFASIPTGFKLKSLPVCLDLWSACLSKLLLYRSPHRHWGISCWVSNSLDLQQQWTVLPHSLVHSPQESALMLRDSFVNHAWPSWKPEWNGWNIERVLFLFWFGLVVILSL